MRTAFRPQPWILLVAGLFLVSHVSWAVPAGDVVVAISGPTASVATGSRTSFWLYALNTSTQQVWWSFPQDIQGRVTSQRGAAEVLARLRDANENGLAAIAPGAFARREYVFKLPDSWSGELTLELLDGPGTRLAFQVQNPPTPVATAEPKKGLFYFLQGRKEAEENAPYNPDDFFKEHIFGYELFYFIAGTKSPNAKFQISFKYRVLNDHGWLAQEVPWLTGLHIAYTQTSLWDWNGPSAPFYDTSYKPELLYSWQRLVGGAPTNWFRLDLQGGFQHESNGKAGADSRSMNIACLRPTLVFGRDTGPQLSLTPRVWTYLGELSDNPDMPDYRGYADLRAMAGWKRGLQVSALGRMGKNGSHRSLQVDVTYPLMQPPYGSFSLYLQAQYFTGYGESLIGYKEKTDVLRAGLSIYR